MIVGLSLSQSRQTFDLPFFGDDFDYVEQAEAVKNSFTALFSPDYKSSGRLGTTVLVTAVYALTGPDPFWFHLLSVVAHASATLVLTLTLLTFGYTGRVSAVAGILFVCSVPGFEVRYWLSCLSYPGCLSAGCISIIWYVRYHRTGSTAHLLYALVSILVAATFHAAAVAFALLAPYFAFRQYGDPFRSLKWASPLVAGSSLFALLMVHLYPAHMQLEAVERATDIGHVIASTFSNLGHAFRGAHWTTAAYARGLSTAELVAGLLAAGSLIPLWRHRIMSPIDAILWVALTVAVFGGSGADGYRSRYFYLSGAGVSLLLGWLIDVATARIIPESRCRTKTVVVFGVTMLIAAASHAYLQQTQSVYKTAVGRSYLSGRDPMRGLGYMAEGLREAPELIAFDNFVRYAKNALVIGDDPRPILNSGITCYPDGDILSDLTRVAAFCFDDTRPPDEWVTAVTDDPRRGDASAVALNNAGLFARRQGDYTRSLEYLGLALTISPRYGSAMINTANTLALAGRHADAMRIFHGFFTQTGSVDVSAREGLEAILQRTLDPRALAYYTRICRIQGDLEEAAQVVLAFQAEDFSSSALLVELERLRADLEAIGAVGVADRIEDWRRRSGTIDQNRPG